MMLVIKSMMTSSAWLPTYVRSWFYIHHVPRIGCCLLQIAVSVAPIKLSGSTVTQQQQPQQQPTSKRAAAVKQFFLQHLGLEPVEESRAYLSYLVDR